ncbi:hypothetical protein PAPYR_6839 [Paratrimastix pyriformis]|uniref:Uncharacterized protein n=1 Tax=Paratrimastix pyriformis TaxID=342808 RepID=A0ABQ8UED1_9EUKA|nr:hypothetical protein PAPYR_6839 [Paratrimastix pyriformis]
MDAMQTPRKLIQNLISDLGEDGIPTDSTDGADDELFDDVFIPNEEPSPRLDSSSKIVFSELSECAHKLKTDFDTLSQSLGAVHTAITAADAMKQRFQQAQAQKERDDNRGETFRVFLILVCLFVLGIVFLVLFYRMVFGNGRLFSSQPADSFPLFSKCT